MPRNATASSRSNSGSDSSLLSAKIEGDKKDNTLFGTSNNDTLYGYGGDDIYYVDGGDVVVEASGAGIDTVYSTDSYTLPANVENLILTGNSGPVLINGNYVYGNPFGWQNLLDHAQGDNSFEYWSDCGIVSAGNVLIQFDLMEQKTESYNAQYYNRTTNSFKMGNIDEAETYLVNYAKEYDLCNESNTNPHNNGGTTVLDQIAILEAHGVEADYNFLTLEGLGYYVKNNYAVIAEIDADVIWGLGSSGGINHAVTVTGVAYNQNGGIEGFYICDSGTMGLPQFVEDRDNNGIYNDDAARFISYDLMSEAFYHFKSGNTYYGLSVVTDNPAKEFVDNIDGTGNSLENIIIGNAGQNILDGKLGDDILYGKGGNDVLIGGSGNDILLGGLGSDVYEFKSGHGTDLVYDEGGIADTFKFNVKSDSISFSVYNDELIIDYAHNRNHITVDGVYSIEYFVDKDNSYITSEDISAVIQQISAYNSESGSYVQNSNGTQEPQDITAYLVDAWKCC